MNQFFRSLILYDKSRAIGFVTRLFLRMTQRLRTSRLTGVTRTFYMKQRSRENGHSSLGGLSAARMLE